tara:strand:- start:472 stop:606 length:135 start_codon:yes stop_codon:yes gene_type:complete
MRKKRKKKEKKEERKVLATYLNCTSPNVAIATPRQTKTTVQIYE